MATVLDLIPPAFFSFLTKKVRTGSSECRPMGVERGVIASRTKFGFVTLSPRLGKSSPAVAALT
jgi:hypothetical protein